MQYIQLLTLRLLAVTLLASGWPVMAVAAGDLLQPIAIRNLNPFIGVYGIPGMQDPVVVSGGRSSTSLTLDVASHFTDNSNQSEFIRIDGETYRLSLRYAKGLTKGWEVGAEAPIVHHTGGSLDGFINWWHSTFGLPTLGRDRVADDQLAFSYSSNGVDRVNLQSSTTGLGDVLVFAGRTVEPMKDHPVTLRAQLKLPTGDPDRLLGSGGVDVSVSASAGRKFGDRWLGAARVGASYLGTGDVLPELQRHWVGFGSLYLGWQASGSVSIKAQLDAQSPVYQDSEFHQLVDPAVQITLGGSIRIGASDFIDLSVTEDEVNFDVSPDVSFQLRWRRVR